MYDYNAYGNAATQVPPAALLAFIGAIWLVMLVFVVIAIIAYWKIFTKAGKPGWAAIIPFYNIIILLEIVGRPAWWIIFMFIPLANIVVAAVILHRLSRAFGHDIGFTIGLLLLSPVFMLILAFGESRYLGVPQP